VLEAWGFRYVSNIIWSKRRRDGGPDGRGVGFYFRNVTEMILFGVRGSMRTLPPARSQVNIIETRKRERSRKPDEQYDLIERCSPGPYLELFARYPRPGWTVWGDESAPDVDPRGTVYKGYDGGPIYRVGQVELPIALPHERMAPSVRHAVGIELRDRYEQGRSIREISDATGYSIARVRSLLQAADTPFRPRGKHA
jgi:hypothetical protein